MTKRTSIRFASTLMAIIATLAFVFGCALPSIYELWDDMRIAELQISPSFIALEANQSAVLSAVGGRGPYLFTLESGSGTLTPLDAVKTVYGAPATATDAYIRVSDASDRTAVAQVFVAPTIEQLRIVPSTASLPPGATVAFTYQGGSPPYAFSMVSGNGTVESASGVYTAPAFDSNDVVCVMDASGQSSEASVLVRTVPDPLEINPITLVIETDASFAFSATGGTPAYVFSATGGFIDAGTGAFTAPDTPTSLTVTVTDSALATAVANVTVVALSVLPLGIIPRSATVAFGDTIQFSAEGGAPPYVYSMSTSYEGTVDPVTGLYTAPISRQGVEGVTVTDSRGIGATATVKIKKK